MVLLDHVKPEKRSIDLECTYKNYAKKLIIFQQKMQERRISYYSIKYFLNSLIHTFYEDMINSRVSQDNIRKIYCYLKEINQLKRDKGNSVTLF